MNTVAPDDLDLVGDYRRARQRLDDSTRLMQWALDLRELLHMGILDLGDARDLVAAFKRECDLYRRGRA